MPSPTCLELLEGGGGKWDDKHRFEVAVVVSNEAGTDSLAECRVFTGRSWGKQLS